MMANTGGNLTGKNFQISLITEGKMLHCCKQTLKASGRLAKLKHTALSALDLTEDSDGGMSSWGLSVNYQYNKKGHRLSPQRNL